MIRALPEVFYVRYENTRELLFVNINMATLGVSDQFDKYFGTWRVRNVTDYNCMKYLQG